MTKQLIINADDFGLANDINRGIIECYIKGAVRGISLLAVGEAFGDAVRRAKENRIEKLGVHLALTESFKPLTQVEQIASALDENGRFFKGYGSFLAKYFSGLVDGEDIHREFKNQILAVKKEGFKISHLNSHQHIHIVPGILKIVMDLMKEEKIDYVRYPREEIGMAERLKDPRLFVRNFILFPFCVLSESLLRKSGVSHNDHFMGHGRALKLKRETLVSMISNTKEGLTELGCHPGYFTEDVKKKHPHYRNCEEELAALCDKNFIDEIKSRGIELVSY